ncbi:MAG: substrate-binding domain-containing protein [Rhizobiales bacterium]|nr:substrate-binding domain-containing protein [Hyphomicrobiales bacterium]MBN9010743.1 substrate-binding domain-containing protein [Hyphomicrobiales bacterium]
MKITRSVIGLAAGALLSASGLAAHAEDKQLYIIGVFHADVSNSFSSVVKKGVEQAGKDLNVKVEFVGPDKFDVVQEGQLIEAAIAKKPDGLFVSLADCDALKPMVQQAIDAGIPVMSFNSGASCFKQVGSLVHVAEDGLEAGNGAGERLVALGAKNVICLNHEVGNAILEDRCNGIKAAVEKAGGKVSIVPTSLADPSVTKGAIESAFLKDPTIDAIGGEWGGGPSPAVIDQTLTELNLQGKVIVSYFDPGLDTLPMIKEGKIAFETSQVPFNQGYLPVEFLAAYLRYGVLPGGPTGVVSNGGFFIDKTNVDKITDLVKGGIY